MAPSSPRARLVLLASLALSFAGADWLAGRPFQASAPSVAAAPADHGASDVPRRPPPAGAGAPEIARAPSDPLAASDAGVRSSAGDAPEIAAIPARTPPLAHTLNVLLVGVDRREGGARGGRPDTLVVVVFDEASEHVGLVSIPRDLYVDVPGHGPARINATFGVARQTGEPELALLRRVVEDTLALPIRHVAAVDLGGFERIVDAVGGVTLEVPCPIEDRFHDRRVPGGRRDLRVPAGRARLDGPTAAMYVRSRHGRSDWSRARRQQAVLFALRRELLDGAGLARLPALWSAVGDMITTDMRRLDLLALAHRAAGVDPAHVHGLLLGHREVRTHTTADGRAVLLPDYAAIDRALASLFEAPRPGAQPARAVCPAADVALRPRADWD